MIHNIERHWIIVAAVVVAASLAIIAWQVFFKASPNKESLKGSYISYMPEMIQSEFDLQKALRKLSDPQSVVVIAPDSVLVSDRVGFVYEISDGVLNRRPVLDISDNVYTEGDAGLIGLLPDVEYETNGYLYITSNHKTADGTTILRFSRYIKNLETGMYDFDMVLQDNILSGTTRVGGWLARGNDGYIYLATGDLGAVAPDDTTDVSGRLYRMNPDGTAPEGLGKVARRGLQNPQGLVWLDSISGMWVVEL